MAGRGREGGWGGAAILGGRACPSWPRVHSAIRRFRVISVAAARGGAHDGCPMPTVQFTPQLRRFIAAPEVRSEATTLRAALDEAFACNPLLRGYVLDDQGALRANVVVFIDGERCQERVRLDQALQPASTVYVLQALSGG
jgi:hypothetical protein